MSDSDIHSESVETSVTAEGGSTTEHTHVEKDGKTVEDETTHPDDDEG